MSGIQQGEMLNSGLDFFQDPGRAKHSVRHLQMCTDLHSLAVRAQDVKFWFSPRSKKHLHINVECWLSLSWILRNGWAICGRQQISRICVLVTNMFPLAGNQLPCNRNVNITDLIQMKLSQHWFLHSTSPTIFLLHLPHLPFYSQIPYPSRSVMWTPSCRTCRNINHVSGTLHYSTSLAVPQITLHHVKHPAIEITVHDTRHLLHNVMWLLKFHQKMFSWSVDYYQIRLELINPNWIWHREHESKTRTILCMHYIHNPVLNIIMLSWRWGFACLKLAAKQMWFFYLFAYRCSNRNLQWMKNIFMHNTEKTL